MIEAGDTVRILRGEFAGQIVRVRHAFPIVNDYLVSIKIATEEYAPYPVRGRDIELVKKRSAKKRVTSLPIPDPPPFPHEILDMARVKAIEI